MRKFTKSISLPVGEETMPADLDLSAAESSLESFTAHLQSLRPKLSANATGISSAVSSAIASIRSMMAFVSVTVPVRAVASMDPSGLPRVSAGNPPGGNRPLSL